MIDIVKRLRKWSIFGYGYEASCDMKEAAIEIQHQRTVVANAARALSEQTQILDALRAEVEWYKKHSARVQEVAATYTRTIMQYRAENDKLRAALESIADLPPGYADMRQDDLVVILANKARAALEGPQDRMAKPLGEKP